MTQDELRSRQQPLKERYRQHPESARVTLQARGTLDLEHLACRVETGRSAIVDAGLHTLAGGDGSWACSGDMLLESLVACAGVTLCAVATALNLPIRGGTVLAEGDLDFRGTLGVSRDIPVGFSSLRLRFDLDGDVEEAQRQQLLKLTERYCVVAQTLSAATPLEIG